MKFNPFSYETYFPVLKQRTFRIRLMYRTSTMPGHIAAMQRTKTYITVVMLTQVVLAFGGMWILALMFFNTFIR